MKYSKEQLDIINKRYRTIKDEIQLKNKRAKAIQNVLVDKVIQADLLDNRNSNDIENDKFAKKALLNKLSREILGTADIEKFQRDLTDEGMEFTFLNQYPEILRESKNFRKATPENIINIVRRLFNRNHSDIFYSSNNQAKRDFNDSMLKMLQTISQNLEELINVYPEYKTRLKDHKDKIDATIITTDAVGESAIMSSVFKQSPDAVNSALSQIATNTMPDPNSGTLNIQNIDPTNILSNINQQSLSDAVDNSGVQINPKSKSSNNLDDWRQFINPNLGEWTDGDNNYNMFDRIYKNKKILKPQYTQFLADLSGQPIGDFMMKSRADMKDYILQYIDEERTAYEEKNKKSNKKTTSTAATAQPPPQDNTANLKSPIQLRVLKEPEQGEWIINSNFIHKTDIKELKKIADDLNLLSGNNFNYDTTKPTVKKIQKSIQDYLITLNTEPKTFNKTRKNYINEFNKATLTAKRMGQMIDYFKKYDSGNFYTYVPESYQTSDEMKAILNRYFNNAP